MIDRLFFTAVTFCLFTGTALAVVGTPFGSQAEAATRAQGREVQLPYVLVVGKRDLHPRVQAHVQPHVPTRTLARTDAAEPATRGAQ